VAATRDRIIAATLDSLTRNGYAGTTARTIAASAGVPVSLVFYHFSTLDALFLALLDHTSTARLPRWQAALADVGDPLALMRTMGRLYDEDVASGHAIAVRELVANGDLSMRLGAEIGLRMAPWFDLAESVATAVLRGSPVLTLLPPRDLAVTVVALYLGLDIVARLAGAGTSAATLVAAGERLAPLLGRLTTTRVAAQRPRRVAID
jgi:AcrR family transcriptional regulator